MVQQVAFFFFCHESPGPWVNPKHTLLSISRFACPCGNSSRFFSPTKTFIVSDLAVLNCPQVLICVNGTL